MLYQDLLEKLGLLRKPVRCFERETEGEPVLNRRDLGVMPVPVEKIAGTVSRCRDIGADFQPRLSGDALRRHHGSRLLRLERIRAAMEQGEIMPPLDLYRLRDDYYVVDGHHRVAVAKEIGVAYLDAHVTDFLPVADTPANVLAHARSSFELTTGLYGIELTDPDGHGTLLAHITEHQSRLAEVEGRPVSRGDAAQDWYREVYLPIAMEIERELTEDAASHQFPGKTVGDLYLLLAEYKWLESERQGRDIGLHQAMLDLQLTTESDGWLQEILKIVVPCRLLATCPLPEGAPVGSVES
jgi:hypothetical protein